MCQAGGGYSNFDSDLGIGELLSVECEDEPCREAVTTPDAIYDVADFVGTVFSIAKGGEVWCIFGGRVEQRAQVVARGRDAFSQSDCDVG